MLELELLTEFRENNRIEAKKARGGLPESIWESYSAFANTLGGVILLGVIEKDDYSLYPVGVLSSKELVDKFWRLLPKMTNRNILRPSDVKIELIEDKEIIRINVPRARRTQKPIYLGSSPYAGTYKRDGEGDYRCTKEEVDSMLEDAKKLSFDMQRVPYREGMLKSESVVSFKARTNSELEVGDTVDVATLLLLGKGEAIREIAPNFYAKYTFIGEQVQFEKSAENLFELFEIAEKETHSESVYKNQVMKDLMLEAVVNAILNADYQAGGVECREFDKMFVVKNNGTFCVDKSLAITGGVSEVRCGRLSDLFSKVIGERKGQGISSIYWFWESLSLCPPEIFESFEPDMITFTLYFTRNKDKSNTNIVIYEQWIINFLYYKPKKKLESIADAFAIPKDLAEEILNSLIERNILVLEKGFYKLKR